MRTFLNLWGPFALTAGLTLLLPAAGGDCPLDHYFVLQQDGQLAVDKRLIYRHGDPAEGYYPLSWSPIYQAWTVGEPGFCDTSDPEHGFPPEVMLEGTPNVDYQIWLEIVDLAADFCLRMEDGTWLTSVGDRYNLSNLPEHHAHVRYYAFVPEDPPPERPFYVTCRLVDELGPYGCTDPFVCVFNVPAAAVETTSPRYRGLLAGTAHTQMSFRFHRPIAVTGGPPVTITDEQTHSHDYYTGYFDYAIVDDGLTLLLEQVGTPLPENEALEVALTEFVRDAAADRPAIPFTLFVATPILGDLDLDGDVDLADLAQLLAHYRLPSGATYEQGDLDGDGDVDLSDLAMLLANYRA